MNIAQASPLFKGLVTKHTTAIAQPGGGGGGWGRGGGGSEVIGKGAVGGRIFLPFKRLNSSLLLVLIFLIQITKMEDEKARRKNLVSTRSHASKGGSLNIHINLITVSPMCHA